MIPFSGTYFDGKSSKPYPVSISFDGIYLHISGAGGTPELEIPLRNCRFTPPLGKTRRSLLLPNGARCDTQDLPAFAFLEKSKSANRGMRLVHFLESRWRLAAGCLLCLIACVWVFTAYGIPLLAKHVAYTIPTEISEKVSRKTLQMLDQNFFKPSELDSARVAELQETFHNLGREAESDFNYRLLFRRSPRIGPNAFALPSGQIVMTDELVTLAENDEELVGILVHEMAHVDQRHGMRMLFQNAGAFLLISALVGDVASITSMAATLPTLLVKSGYSRKFEREADQAAGAYFIRKGRDTKSYRDILLRLSENRPENPAMSMISSHPETEKRIKYLQELEKALR